VYKFPIFAVVSRKQKQYLKRVCTTVCGACFKF
jgi:hypothetical protein